jgi:hypothetical protein
MGGAGAGRRKWRRPASERRRPPRILLTSVFHRRQELMTARTLMPARSGVALMCLYPEPMDLDPVTDRWATPVDDSDDVGTSNLQPNLTVTGAVPSSGVEG